MPGDDGLENNQGLEEPNSGLDDGMDASSDAPAESSAPQEQATTSAKSAVSGIAGIVQWFLKLPPAIKTAIGAAFPYVLIAIAGLLAILFLHLAAAYASEELFEVLPFAEELQKFNETVGDFFTGKLFVTDEEKAAEAEQKYFKKLEEVYNYYLNNYNVRIDTTLITETLFYDRGISDYEEDEDVKGIEDAGDQILEDGTTEDENIYQEEANFYKVAKRHIKTLAKFQIVENTSYNACPNNYEPQSKITPESDKEIADTWAGFYGWNTRATFNYQPYQQVAHPKIDGTSRNITYCEFQNAEDQLSSSYKEDYAIYKPYKDAYNSCVADCNQQVCDNPDDPSDCHQKCDPETACATQKAERDEWLGKLQGNWGDVYDIGSEASENSSFRCSPSGRWGQLNGYTDSRRYHNYRFPEDWIDKGTDYTFWESAIDALRGLVTGPISEGIHKIDCSAKPAIMYTYTTSIAREGVYYYKLLSRNTKFLSNKSFIERYYPNEFGENDSDEQKMKDAIDIVDKIYDAYEYVTDNREYCDYTTDYSAGSGGYVFGGGTSVASPNITTFISQIASMVVEDMKRTGIPASTTIAQAIAETGGSSGLSNNFNNYYGMKVGGTCTDGMDTSREGVAIKPGEAGNRCTGNRYWDGTVVRMCNKARTDCAWYRVYDGFENSTADHSRNLNENSAYSDCRGLKNNSVQFAQCIAGHYATDPAYARKLVGHINTYDLGQYDIGYTGTADVIENDVPLVGESGGTTAGGSTETGGDSFAEVQQHCIPRVGAAGAGTISTDGVNNAPTIGACQDRTSVDYKTYWWSSNNLFYASGYPYQCTWYAHGRGLQILTSNGMSMDTARTYMNPMNGDAWKWFHQNQYFNTSTDYTKPKVGAIIVWRNGNKPGHVAVIEEINRGPNGEITSIKTTEGGTSVRDGCGQQGYAERERTLDYIKAHGTYTFIGYVYLLG